MMKTRVGDLLQLAEDGDFDVIVHGCNCQQAMGKGIAKVIKARFPEAYAADLQTAKGDPEKLGSISYATVTRGEVTLHVVNAYTQVHWRGRGKKVSEEAIRQSMRAIKQTFSGLRIGYPKIGAGLGGGDWATIAQIIDTELEGEDHTLVVLPTDSLTP